MNLQDTVRQQLGFWHGTLEQIMSDCDDAMLHKTLPSSNIGSAASIYAHAVISEDAIVHGMLQGKQPLFIEQGWEAKTGVANAGMPPMQTPEWAAKVRMNLPQFQEYAQLVYAATDAYIAALPDAELDRKMQMPFGESNVAFIVATLLGTHLPGHAGEIAALKGVSGLKGLPF
jgi:hypothetical protein